MLALSIAVIVRDRLDDRVGFLRSGGVIKIHERPAVNAFAQNRKIGADSSRRRNRRSLRLADLRQDAGLQPGRSSDLLPLPLTILLRSFHRERSALATLSRRSRTTASVYSRAAPGFHAVDALARKRLQQQAARLRLVNAAGAEIEQRVLLDLADGGAVGALHVVGVDFELRLGVDLRIVGSAAGCDWSAWRRSSAHPCAR